MNCFYKSSENIFCQIICSNVTKVWYLCGRLWDLHAIVRRHCIQLFQLWRLSEQISIDRAIYFEKRNYERWVTRYRIRVTPWYCGYTRAEYLGASRDGYYTWSVGSGIRVDLATVILRLVSSRRWVPPSSLQPHSLLSELLNKSLRIIVSHRVFSDWPNKVSSHYHSLMGEDCFTESVCEVWSVSLERCGVNAVTPKL